MWRIRASVSDRADVYEHYELMLTTQTRVGVEYAFNEVLYKCEHKIIFISFYPFTLLSKSDIIIISKEYLVGVLL